MYPNFAEYDFLPIYDEQLVKDIFDFKRNKILVECNFKPAQLVFNQMITQPTTKKNIMSLNKSFGTADTRQGSFLLSASKKSSSQFGGPPPENPGKMVQFKNWLSSKFSRQQEQPDVRMQHSTSSHMSHVRSSIISFVKSPLQGRRVKQSVLQSEEDMRRKQEEFFEMTSGMPLYENQIIGCLVLPS